MVGYDMQFYRITKGLNSVGKLIPETENIYDHIKEDRDYYLSVYKYNEQHKAHAEVKINAEKVNKKTGEVLKYVRDQGVDGITDVVTNILGFDFDHKTDLSLAKQDTITLVNRLIENQIDVEDICVSFSGGKGFSVVVNHDTDLTPDQHKALAKALAGDLKTWDTTLYNASRIFRIDGTRHNVTGLYKTQIDPDMLYEDVSTIKEYARKKQPIKKFKTVSLSQDLLSLPPKEKEVEKVERQIDGEFGDIDFSKKPSYLTNVKYVLHKGFIPPGYGNEGMMILCSTYKFMGFDKTDAFQMLVGVNQKRTEIYGPEHERSDDEIQNQIVDYVYSDHWKGGTYSEKESELLQVIAKTYNIQDKTSTVGIDQIKNRFLDFSKNINSNVIKTGIRSIDRNVLLTTGMMVGWLGAPSSGKTSTALTLVESQSLQGLNSLVLSLDMHDNLLYTRLLQQQTGIDITKKLRKLIVGDDFYDPNYSIEDDPDLLDAHERVCELYQNADFNFVRGCTIESIEDEIIKSKQRHGNNLKLVVVDYLEKVRGPYSDATANSGYVASRLSDLASTYDVLVLLLLQTQKSSGDPSEPLTSMRNVKGASIIEQDSRVILSMWRPGFNPQDSSNDMFASVAIVKNNMGDVKQLDFKWNGIRGKLHELTNSERERLRQLLEAIAEEKRKEKEENGF